MTEAARPIRSPLLAGATRPDLAGRLDRAAAAAEFRGATIDGPALGMARDTTARGTA